MTQITEKNRPLADSAARKTATDELEKNILVEAGAGTGKTTILIDRIFNLLKDGKAGIDEIVAITFTEKATGEMVERLRTTLQKACVGGDLNSTQRENILNAVRDFNSHRISTIHGLCRYVLLQMPFEAGIDPAFTIVDDFQEKELKDELWESWISKELEKEDSPVRYGYLVGLKNDFFKELFDFLYKNRAGIDKSDTTWAGVFTAQAVDETGRHLGELVALRDSCCSSPGDKGYVQIAELKRNFERVKNADEHLQMALLLELKPGRLDAGDAKAWNGMKKEKTRLCTELAETLESWKSRLSDQLMGGISDRFIELVRRMESVKKKAAVLSQDDLLIKTRKLLKENHWVRRYFQGRFKKILVDEFQDTDPMQTEIVFFLCEEWDGFTKTDTDWAAVKLTPGKLFLVGDPKQSIYSFRNADIEIYKRTKILLEGGGGVVPITVNFRSRKGIIDWVNAQFKGHFDSGDYAVHQPLYEELESRDIREGTALTVLNPDGEITDTLSNAVETCRKEAAAVAYYIRKMVEDKTIIKPKGEKERPLKYGDIALLFSKYRYMPYFEEALTACRIPFILDGGRLFYQREEIRGIMLVLKAVDNPRDDLSVGRCAEVTVLFVQ